MDVKDVIDKAELLDRVGGDLELLGEVIDIFLEDCPRSVLELRSAAETLNWEQIHRSAHAIKGSVANFSAKKAAILAARLESVGTDHDGASVTTAMNELEIELNFVCAALQKLKEEIS